VLGDWFATMIQVRRGRFVLAISGVTLLPVIVVGREPAGLRARLADAVADVLLELDIHRDAIERERLAMAEATYARTNDRSTVGVLTDFQRLLRYDLEDAPNTGLLERSLRFAETPIVARSLTPDRATRALFGAIKTTRLGQG
jgi:hypothetical protein